MVKPPTFQSAPFLLVLALFLTGCEDGKDSQNQKLSEKLETFYKTTIPDLNSYTPISFEIDTLEVAPGSIQINLRVVHTCRLTNTNGNERERKDTFGIVWFPEQKEALILSAPSN